MLRQQALGTQRGQHLAGYEPPRGWPPGTGGEQDVRPARQRDQVGMIGIRGRRPWAAGRSRRGGR
jgi:hypothetical protein